MCVVKVVLKIIKLIQNILESALLLLNHACVY